MGLEIHRIMLYRVIRESSVRPHFKSISDLRPPSLKTKIVHFVIQQAVQRRSLQIFGGLFQESEKNSSILLSMRHLRLTFPIDSVRNLAMVYHRVKCIWRNEACLFADMKWREEHWFLQTQKRDHEQGWKNNHDFCKNLDENCSNNTQKESQLQKFTWNLGEWKDQTRKDVMSIIHNARFRKGIVRSHGTCWTILRRILDLLFPVRTVMMKSWPFFFPEGATKF